jgi:hypothetical protein
MRIYNCAFRTEQTPSSVDHPGLSLERSGLGLPVVPHMHVRGYWHLNVHVVRTLEAHCAGGVRQRGQHSPMDRARCIPLDLFR